jgi:Kdo2-lipid IVA lauroyltransferase/acyltransferase
MSRASRFALENAAALAVSGLVRPLSRSRALAVGRALGRRWGSLDPRHVAIAESNLAHAFPDWDAARRRAVALGVYEHFGRMLLDILWLAPRSREEVLRHVVVEGGEHVEAAHRAGRGIVFPTAHMGNWEIHGVAHGHLFAPIGVIARPLDNPALDRRLVGFRQSAGNTVIYKQKALGQVMRLLRDNRGVAILIDQNVQEKDGVFVDFFGRKAATTTVAAALALKTGCALLPGHTELMPDGRYRLSYEPPVVVEPTGDHAADLVRITQQLTSIIEGWVRKTPEQWLWLHRRWKTRPAGEMA